MEPFTLRQASKALTDEAYAWELFETFRWPNGAMCPRCHDFTTKYLAPREGVRRTRTGKETHRRVWKCAPCGRQFTALVGTIFEDSKIPIGKWIMAIYLMASAKNGVSAHELHRDLGITYKTAWFMCHRLRLAMSLSPAADKWSGGVVVSDETWIGGAPKNRHGQPEKHSGQRRKPTDKTPVVSLLRPETGEVRSQVVRAVSGGTVGQVIDANVDMPNTVLHTDSATFYQGIGAEMKGHESVNHHEGEYVRGVVTTNMAEGYFSQLKRSLDGTHHHVSREHLGRYTGEFDFRYTTCKLADSERAVRMIRQAPGKRLTYDGLIGKGVRPPLSGPRPRPLRRQGPSA